MEEYDKIPVGKPRENMLCFPMKVKDLRFMDIFSEHLSFLPDDAEVLSLRTNLSCINICQRIIGVEPYDSAITNEVDVHLSMKVNNVFMEIKYNLPEKRYAIG